MGIHCLRDDSVELSIGVYVSGLTMGVYFSHILFVLENFFMILIIYFTYHPNAWYSLTVTVCVCQLQFRPFISSQLDFKPFVSCQLSS